jgi:hypothetical protein
MIFALLRRPMSFGVIIRGDGDIAASMEQACTLIYGGVRLRKIWLKRSGRGDPISLEPSKRVLQESIPSSAVPSLHMDVT